MRMPGWLHGHDQVFALLIGLTDGILTALTLAAGKIVRAQDVVDLSLALRISLSLHFSIMVK